MRERRGADRVPAEAALSPVAAVNGAEAETPRSLGWDTLDRSGPASPRRGGQQGQQTWTGWAILTYNLDTLAVRSA
jgi:hypothetical protein